LEREHAKRQVRDHRFPPIPVRQPAAKEPGGDGYAAGKTNPDERLST
jgi:hypothetical protein